MNFDQDKGSVKTIRKKPQKQRRASFQTPSKKYTGSDNEDEEDYNNFNMNICFINYSALDEN